MPHVRIPYNAWVSSTTLAGVPVFTGVRALIEDNSVEDDPGMVEIMPDASSAMAPLLRKRLYTGPGTCATATTPGWQRGDLVHILSYPGGAGSPLPLVYHVLRAYEVPWPNPIAKVAMARLDMLYLPALLKVAITDQTPGALPTSDYDALRAYQTTYTDGSHGRGWQVRVGTAIYQGYFPAVPITLSLNEYSTIWLPAIEGAQSAEQPVIITEAPLVIKKWDLLVLDAGTPAERRFVASDVTHVLQRMGVSLATLQRVEYHRREQSPWIYAIPLP